MLLPCPLQTVPANQVTQMARPLPKQKVDKDRVWVFCIGGAVALFLGTLAVENNDKFFPAISRANQASNMMKKAAEVGAGRGRRCKLG